MKSFPATTTFSDQQTLINILWMQSRLMLPTFVQRHIKCFMVSAFDSYGMGQSHVSKNSGRSFRWSIECKWNALLETQLWYARINPISYCLQGAIYLQTLWHVQLLTDRQAYVSHTFHVGTLWLYLEHQRLYFDTKSTTHYHYSFSGTLIHSILKNQKSITWES